MGHFIRFEHVQLSSGVRFLKFGLSHHIRPYFEAVKALGRLCV